MISVKCDGCGKVEETRYTECGYMRSVYVPVSPPGWWEGLLHLSGPFRQAANAYHACSGACVDKVTAEVEEPKRKRESGGMVKSGVSMDRISWERKR